MNHIQVPSQQPIRPTFCIKRFKFFPQEFSIFSPLDRAIQSRNPPTKAIIQGNAREDKVVSFKEISNVVSSHNKKIPHALLEAFRQIHLILIELQMDLIKDFLAFVILVLVSMTKSGQQLEIVLFISALLKGEPNPLTLHEIIFTGKQYS